MQEKDVNLERDGSCGQREREEGSYVNKDGRNTGFSRPKRGKEPFPRRPQAPAENSSSRCIIGSITR